MPLPFWSLPLNGHFSLPIHQPGRTTRLPMLPAHSLPVYCIDVVPSEAPHHHRQLPSFHLLTDACSSSGSAQPVPSPGSLPCPQPLILPPEHPCFLPSLPTLFLLHQSMGSLRAGAVSLISSRTATSTVLGVCGVFHKYPLNEWTNE